MSPYKTIWPWLSNERYKMTLTYPTRQRRDRRLSHSNGGWATKAQNQSHSINRIIKKTVRVGYVHMHVRMCTSMMAHDSIKHIARTKWCIIAGKIHCLVLAQSWTSYNRLEQYCLKQIDTHIAPFTFRRINNLSLPRWVTMSDSGRNDVQLYAYIYYRFWYVKEIPSLYILSTSNY